MTKKSTTAAVPLREYVEALLREKDARDQQRFDAQSLALNAALLSAEKAVQTALIAAEKAVTKAETAAEKRFDAVNEFRGAYQDIIAQQMPRAEAEQRLTSMAEKLDDLKGSSRAGANALWGYLAAAAAIAVAVVALILK